MVVGPQHVPDAPRIGDLISRGERSFSFEFFPPKDDEGEQKLFDTIHELEPLRPTFVSVTYGAGGTTRENTLAITARIARETTLLPMGHLTCVGHTEEELRGILADFAGGGVRNVLALRGDPPEGPRAPWRATQGGLERAVELVRLARRAGDFGIGVAAFPEGNPASASLELDARILVEKAEAGAQFAVTQLFFTPEPYLELVDRVRALGCDIPIIPGIMPILNLRQVSRMAELSGAEVPPAVLARFEGLEGPDVRRTGVELATRLCEDLLDNGAPGLHFYTLNRSRATREIWAGLGAATVPRA